MYLLCLFLCMTLAWAGTCNMHRLPWSQLAHIGGEQLLTYEYPIIFHSPEGKEATMGVLSELTSMEHLRTHYGDTTVLLSSSNAYSHGRLESTLVIYLNTILSLSKFHSDAIKATLPADQVYYLFGGNYDGVWKEIIRSYKVRYCGDVCEIAGAKTPGIGGENSGVAFHYHGPGFAEVLHGSKEWFFYPPFARDLIDRVGNANNMTTFHWKSCILPLLRNHISESEACYLPVEITTAEKESLLASLQECTIFPNELIFFPSNWMHATLNLEPYNFFVSTFMDPQLITNEKNEKVKLEF